MPIARLATDRNRPREDRVQRAAQEAWDGGAAVFVATIPFTGGTSILKGKGHPDVGKEVEAILRMGWRLDTWEVLLGGNGYVVAAPLFIRPDAIQPIRDGNAVSRQTS